MEIPPSGMTSNCRGCPYIFSCQRDDTLPIPHYNFTSVLCWTDQQFACLLQRDLSAIQTSPNFIFYFLRQQHSCTDIILHIFPRQNNLSITDTLLSAGRSQLYFTALVRQLWVHEWGVDVCAVLRAHEWFGKPSVVGIHSSIKTFVWRWGAEFGWCAMVLA